MDIKSTQGVAAADSKEQTRSWSPKQMQLRMDNQNLNYDFTRSHLNFEIVDGEVKEVDKKSLLDDCIRDNLKRRGIPHPDEAKSHVKKGQPEPEKMKRNVAARMILGGTTERMNEIAFGSQNVNFEKGSDNSHITRSKDIERWAKDEYAYLERTYGKGSVARFIVHLDESWVHAHATVIPTAIIKKKERVSWRTVFGGSLDVSRPKWKKLLDEHYEQVGKQWGLDRGDPVEITHAKHRSTRDYNKELNKENARLVQENANLTTDVANLTTEKETLSQEKADLQKQYNVLQDQHTQLSGKHTELVAEHASLIEKTDEARKNLAAISSRAEQLTMEMGKNMKAMKSLTSMIENKMMERGEAIEDLRMAQAQRDSGKISAEQYDATVAETNAKVDAFDAFIKGKTESLTVIGTQLMEKQTELQQLHTDYDTLLAEVDAAKEFKKENGSLWKRFSSYIDNTMTERAFLDIAKRLNAIPEGEKVDGLSELAKVLKAFADGYPEQIEKAKKSGYKLGYKARNTEIQPDIERLRSAVSTLGATAQQTQNANLSSLIALLEKLARDREEAIRLATEKIRLENDRLKNENKVVTSRNAELSRELETEKTATTLLSDQLKREKVAINEVGNTMIWTSGPKKGKELTNQEYQKILRDQFKAKEKELRDEKIAREQERLQDKNDWIAHKRHMRELKGLLISALTLDVRRFVDIIIDHWKAELKDFKRDMVNELKGLIFGAESTVDNRRIYVSKAFVWAVLYAELENDDKWKPDRSKLEPLKVDAVRIAEGTWESYHSNQKLKDAAVKAVASLANTPNRKYWEESDIKAVNTYLKTVTDGNRSTAIAELKERAANEYNIRNDNWLDNVISRIKDNTLGEGVGLGY